MKKALNLCLLLFCVALTNLSCSNDEETKPSIVGTWEWSKRGSIGDDNIPYDITDYVNGCSSKKDNWIFTKEGIFKTTENGDCEDEPYTRTYNYTLEDGLLNYVNTNNDQDAVEINPSYTVLSITATHLKLKKSSSKLAKLEKSSADQYFEFVRK